MASVWTLPPLVHTEYDSIHVHSHLTYISQLLNSFIHNMHIGGDNTIPDDGKFFMEPGLISTLQQTDKETPILSGSSQESLFRSDSFPDDSWDWDMSPAMSFGIAQDEHGLGNTIHPSIMPLKNFQLEDANPFDARNCLVACNVTELSMQPFDGGKQLHRPGQSVLALFSDKPRYNMPSSTADRFVLENASTANLWRVRTTSMGGNESSVAKHIDTEKSRLYIQSNT
jgi:hypothetical protein